MSLQAIARVAINLCVAYCRRFKRGRSLEIVSSDSGSPCSHVEPSDSTPPLLFLKSEDSLYLCSLSCIEIVSLSSTMHIPAACHDIFAPSFSSKMWKYIYR